MRDKRSLICWGLVLLLVIPRVKAFDFSGDIGIESLGFFHNGVDASQHNHYLSGSLEFELTHEWDKGTQSIAFVPFYRYSQHDQHRTHFDIRELTWMKTAQNWELRVGIRKEFWGVTESQHLVDIINQTDNIENTDTEDKLGQPMINLALIQDWGTIDLYLLTGFRERTFAGQEGRLRSDPKMDTGEERYEKHGIEKHLAYAIRWSHSIGDWDLGFSHFYGMSREPSIQATIDTKGTLTLRPYYEMIHQTGIEVQVTKENWLWKLESIVRSGQGKTFYAGTGGVEYSFYDVMASGVDIGFVAEYLYDSRGNHAPTPFQDDFLAAVRFAFNDTQSTEILAGVIFDRSRHTKFYSL
ncbi:MAG: hypothetical protein KAU26_01905, partial [Methylococcales bacterium]|nr:hypothetical protein [Methylococcales bacterium]